MGIPAPAGVGATGTPPAGDQANAVLTGTFGAVGVSLPFAFRGPMNVAIWAAITTTLTTTAGSRAATVTSASGLAVGNGINSINVPRGTIIAGLSGTNVTLSQPATVTGADAVASYTGAAIAYVATVQIERSFDGGSTWIVCNIGGSGTLAQWTAGTPLSLTFGEPEREVLYRLACIAWSSGLINYRISQTGGAAESLAIGPLSGG